MTKHKMKSVEPEDRLEIVGTITLELTSDRYVDQNSNIIPSKTAMWLRFPMYEAIASDGTKFDVCHSGGAIIIGVERKGQESRYYCISVTSELIRQVDAVDRQKST